MKSQDTLGFAAPLLGLQNVRLPILFRGEKFLVLEKPAGVLLRAHPWYPKCPDIENALSFQVENKKPEFARESLLEPRGVYSIDPEMTGMGVFAEKDEPLATLRNDYGSEKWTFTFRFLAREAGSLEPEFVCELPLAQGDAKHEVFVSHRQGKKAMTHFSRGERVGRYTWWEAKTPYPRLHQVRVHAMESGLSVLGEHLYGSEPIPKLSELKRFYKKAEEERPLYDTICIHLSEIAFPDSNGKEISVQAPLPQKLAVLVKKLTQAR